MRKAIPVIILSALILAGCGKEIDADETHAGLVHGTQGLYRFCDGTTLIYYTDISGSDDIVEAVWPGLCVWDPKKNEFTYNMESVTATNTPASTTQTIPTNGNMDDGDR